MAVAIALTPFAIVPAVVLLLTPRPRATAGAFLAGWASGVALATGVAMAVADLVDAYAASTCWVPWAKLVLGVALVAVGIARWRSRRQTRAMPAWLRGVHSATPRHAFGLGLLASAANPKVLVLAFAGGATLAATADSLLPALLAVLVFTAVSSIGVATPWLAFLVSGGRAVRVLAHARAWLEANAAALMAIIFIVLGIALAIGGASGL
jgi:threonine/homoserine/homoserine lactone efflux protein